MEGQHVEEHPVPETVAARCGVENCEHPVALESGSRPLCAMHFAAETMKEIDARIETLKSLAYEVSMTDYFRDFLNSIEQQARTIAENESAIEPQARVRVEEVLRRVAQMNLKLRRSQRFAASVPVWLRREDPGRMWEEQTWTSSISRHGASFLCNRPVEVGGEVVLCRRDKGNRIRAKVVYCRYDADGRREMGVELLDKADFWDLEKRIQSATVANSSDASN
jgi:hypothetical protein